MSNAPSERRVILLVGLIQFINIVDFMMVMPLGPDFARALAIPTSQIGVIGGAYTLAAALAAIVGARFLDRFDRRRGVALALIGLAIGTGAAALADNLSQLVAARVVAGLFGGPVSSLSIAMVIDVVPESRRGRAMAFVMAAFSASSVLGVPAGLELARLGSWQTPFLVLGAVGLLTAAAAAFMLPSMRGHLLSEAAREVRVLRLIRRPESLTGLLAVGLAMLAAFMIIPHISAYLQFNLGYPRQDIGYLYMAGGAASFVVMQAAGRVVDRWGAVPVTTAGTLVVLGVLLFGFYRPPPFSILLLFVGFMAGLSIRMVATTTALARVPAPHERAGFLSLQSAVQHLAAAAGAMGSAAVLGEAAGGALTGMPGLALAAMALTAVQPFLLWRLQRQLRARAAAGEIR